MWPKATGGGPFIGARVLTLTDRYAIGLPLSG
jgi:hypothetical protein